MDLEQNTVMSLHDYCYKPWMAALRFTELKLLVDSSFSLSFLRIGMREVVLTDRFFPWFSPHRLDPPCVYGMLRSAMPCRACPLASSRDTPSHCIGNQHDNSNLLSHSIHVTKTCFFRSSTFWSHVNSSLISRH
jgi:hypothetical protein